MNSNCIVVLGPTASGKTKLACNLAYYLNGEIISADSRQVYKQLTIGTGKDLEEYCVNGQTIPFHLIDIVEPGVQFYLHQFAEGLNKAFTEIRARNKMPIICGGTGLYLDTLQKDFSLTEVKENTAMRKELEPLPKEELLNRLQSYRHDLIKHVDINSKKRIIRGIEVAEYQTQHKLIDVKKTLPYQPLYIGVNVSAEERKRKITARLTNRLQNGMIEEVETLLKSGVTHQRLETLGLEYKFVSYFLQQKISSEQLFSQLQTAIFQFSKRQMTWFRKMEKEGIKINWVSPNNPVTEILDLIKTNFTSNNSDGTLI